MVLSLFCQQCGDEVASRYRYCPACGRQNFTSNRALAGTVPAGSQAAGLTAAWAPASAPAASVLQPAPSSPLIAVRGPFGGFWRRLTAYIIDSALLTLALTVIGVVISVVAPNADEDSLAMAFVLLSPLIAWVYFANGESGSHQATLGKRAMGLRVTDDFGQPIGFGKASGRFFAKFLSSLPLGIGFLLIGITERKQGLHDMVAGTCVIHPGE